MKSFSLEDTERRAAEYSLRRSTVKNSEGVDGVEALDGVGALDGGGV